MGHSDGSPNNALAAYSDDNDPCYGTGQSCSATSWDLQRRTHTLNTGGVVWDIAGNVWEWTSYYNSEGRPNSGSSWTEYSSVTSDGSATHVTDLRPTKALKDYWNDSWNSEQGIGLYYPHNDGQGGALRRGGAYMVHQNDSRAVGLFTASLYQASGHTEQSTGFRCTYPHP